jgi:hypothetical protein
MWHPYPSANHVTLPLAGLLMDRGKKQRERERFMEYNIIINVIVGAVFRCDVYKEERLVI